MYRESDLHAKVNPFQKYEEEGKNKYKVIPIYLWSESYPVVYEYTNHELKGGR
jgi:hypothetical protein